MTLNRMPAAEVDVTPELAGRLLAAQHPDLAHLPIEMMANGWDNVMYRLGGDHLVRLPRREMAVRCLVHEQRWLPVLRDRLPLPIPAPVRVGRPGSGYPWPWSVVPYLPGRVAADADAADAAVDLSGFLRALHTPAAADAPDNPVRGVPLADRAATMAENLRAVGDQVDREAVTRVWEVALAAPAWGGPPVWLHGDLHPANILVHQDRVSAVIDFGDITSGDPATDLSVAWMLLSAERRDTFRSAYGAADDALWTRARGWALVLGLVFLAHSADNPVLARVGRRTIDAVLG